MVKLQEGLLRLEGISNSRRILPRVSNNGQLSSLALRAILTSHPLLAILVVLTKARLPKDTMVNNSGRASRPLSSHTAKLLHSKYMAKLLLSNHMASLRKVTANRHCRDTELLLLKGMELLPHRDTQEAGIICLLNSPVSKLCILVRSRPQRPRVMISCRSNT